MELNIHQLKSLYVELTKAQLTIVQLERMCDNTESTLACINSSANEINEVSSKYSIPQYNQELKLDDIKTNGKYYKDLFEKNDTCRSALNAIGKAIDVSIQYVSKEIERLYQTYSSKSSDSYESAEMQKLNNPDSSKESFGNPGGPIASGGGLTSYALGLTQDNTGNRYR